MIQKLLSIGKTAKMIGVSIQTLRRWDATGKLKSFRISLTGNRYYLQNEIEEFLAGDIAALAERWAKSKNPSIPKNDYYCPSRDVFEGRLSKLKNDLEKLHESENLSPLIVAISGEIGNNSFDHNLGVWPDTAGIFLGYNLKKKTVVLADRGQGLLQTLIRVKPQLKNDRAALKTAFTEVITGRAPEQRGNGLKFVKNIITKNPFTLFYHSGTAELFLKKGDSNLKIKKASSGFHGCIAKITF